LHVVPIGAGAALHAVDHHHVGTGGDRELDVVGDPGGAQLDKLGTPAAERDVEVAHDLIEAFEYLQLVRLRHQVAQFRAGRSRTTWCHCRT
jgi:hypothetical protein